MQPFSDPEAVAKYAQGPPRIVPGFADLQRMTALLLAEHAPENARVLVLGAGGGLELKCFAEAHAGWTFDGVDPSAEMLSLAGKTLGPLVSRVRLHEGTVEVAPEGPFDAATCLLTMHFIPLDERRHAVAEVHRRLKPGSPFVVAHLSFPQGEGERDAWLSRYFAFAGITDSEPGKLQAARATIDAKLTILSPEQEEAILREAGFTNISLFYAGLAFRGWVASAGRSKH
ncbi:hypothetical protein Pan44_12720 [Caulifigura coniformis]|uniref:Methyltransferase domain-containing protein n=1 Tax=Caulifigura coniformis TaxID=2527983 RepID=A0A517SAY4_9PLAN|nr:class I SAM-dependent methyltransferase [Caulifigura coniformis]QDT53256.1 hypothetical protein Pan44_12720 [Caulifigura coniformis]